MLTSTSLVVVFGLGVLLGIYRFIVHPAFISPLRHVPNAHWSVPFSPAWILWTRFRNNENSQVHAAHLRHGAVIRLGPNEISVNGVDGGIRSVYGGGFDKGQWYSIFDNYGVPCMFSSHARGPHSMRKRMISNVYSKSAIHASRALDSQSSIILYSRLLPIIATSASETATVQGLDVHDLWNATAMDFITAYQFGLAHSSNFLQNPEYRRHWLSLYHSRKTHTFFPQELPRLTKFMRAIGVRLVPSWVDENNRELEAWCADLCQSTTAYSLTQNSYDSNPYDEPVVLNAVLAGIEKEKNTKGSDSIIRDTTLSEPELSLASEMIDHLAAGHETSAITLTYLTWHLSKDLELQKRLREELLSLDNPLIYPPPMQDTDIKLPTSKQLDSLPVLHAVIMETLRLNAAIPGSQPRMTPYPSSSLGGYQITGGVRVDAAAYSLHRNEEAYPSPEKWDYTRWLERNEGPAIEKLEAKRNRDKFFWAFSSGGRMCIGSNFAMHEIKLVTAAVYSNFITHIVSDDGIEQTDGYTCGPKGNELYLRFEKSPV